MAKEPVRGQYGFALDIGTRKVIGLLTEPCAQGLRIVAAEKLEHKTRAMYDGQIHDVVEVASVVQQIKQKLEARAKQPLTEVSVAAAGRALRTFAGAASRELSGLKELDEQEVFSLELEAVQDAQRRLAEGLRGHEEAQDYHYVGHSVVGRQMDGLPIGNLVGQRGLLARAEVIATFLPRGVVDSLLAVLERVGLEMTALTLEPIAALNVVLPPTMRHLNLVLVDIGAGTSDIAITNHGTVVAYDMVPVAGDEITEALSQEFILDFPVGEQVKRALTKSSVTFTDILGMSHTMPSAEVVERILPAVHRLASQIAQSILRLNGKPPQAVVLVGGGSMTPRLPEIVASELGIPTARVAVRGRDAIAGVTGAKTLLNGPDCVTPIGIAVSGRDQSTLGFAYVNVGKRGVRLFNPARLTVADALLAAGVTIKDLRGRVGPGLTITINGSLRMIPGTFGKPAEIQVNGNPATLETPIVHRDHITILPAEHGQAAQATVGVLAGELTTYRIQVNGELLEVPPLLSVNGQIVEPARTLHDNDVLIAYERNTLGQALELVGFTDAAEWQTLRLTVDGQPRLLRQPRYRILVGGRPADSELPLVDGLQVACSPAPPARVADVLGQEAVAAALRVWVNGQLVECKPKAAAASATRNGHPCDLDELVIDGDTLTTPVADAAAVIFADLLPYAEISKKPPTGASRLIMTLNGKPAEFTTAVQDGDRAELVWQ